MPRNGTGTYTLPAGNPFITGSVISSTTMNNTLSDIAAAITDSVANDGQTPILASQDFGGFNLSNVGTLSASGVNVTQATGSSVNIAGNAGTRRSVFFKTNSSSRWGLICNTEAETGSNAGSNLNLTAFADNGATEFLAMTVARSSLRVLMAGRALVTGVSPTADNTLSCGEAAFRWSVVYAGSGTINTSDAREKTPIEPLSSPEIDAAKALSREIGTYRFLNAIALKGDEARHHIGLTVQRAIEVMESFGLDPFRYGFICYDTWAANEPDDLAATEAGDRYSFRPDELLLFIARGFEARLAALEGAT